MSQMIHETEKCKNILDILKMFTPQVAIAGGYPRDLLLGREPKDLDIIVADLNDFGLELVHAALKDIGCVLEIFSDNPPSAKGNPRVKAVIKAAEDIDIIFWDNSFKTIQDIVNNFDFNINQFVLDLRWEHPSYFLGDIADYGKLVQIRESEFAVSQKRKLKVIKIAEELNWSTEECQNKMNNQPTQPQMPKPL